MVKLLSIKLKFQVSYADRNCWTCPECEQYNGFTEDGDYNRDLDLTSSPGTRFATNQNMSGHIQGNGLCHQCNLNQVSICSRMVKFPSVTVKRIQTESRHYAYVRI